MNRIENLWFKLVFVGTLFAFGALNAATYVTNAAAFAERRNQRIVFSRDGVHWGFPFKMYMPFSGFDTPAVLVNGAIIILSAGMLGLIAQLVSNKFRNTGQS